MISRVLCVCVFVCVQGQKGEKMCVLGLIYDVVLVINMALLSHLDAVIDTWSSQHMDWELELV